MTQLNLFGPCPTGHDAHDERPRLNSTVAPEDVPRLKASLQRLYDHMRDGMWYSATQLEMIAGRRYGGRLHELAKAGIPHESKCISGGEWEYRLISSPNTGNTTNTLTFT